MTLKDGTVIPQYTATTTLSPDQQKLYDQNNQIATSLNGLAQQGITGVGNAVANPLTAGQFDPLQHAPQSGDSNAARDQATNAVLARLLPSQQQDTSHLQTMLANQGLDPGSEAYQNQSKILGQQQNDARTQAVLTGDQEQNQLFNQGLASSTFNNQAQQQAIQEAQFYQTNPLNTLNALRSGNQVSMPTFGNYSSGAQVQPAPLYAAANDSYANQMAQYNANLSSSNGFLSGLGSLGSAAIMASDRRLKKDIQLIGPAANGLNLYAFSYLDDRPMVGHMADEVELVFPDAILWFDGFAMVDYGRIG